MFLYYLKDYPEEFIPKYSRKKFDSLTSLETFWILNMYKIELHILDRYPALEALPLPPFFRMENSSINLDTYNKGINTSHG